MFIRHSDKLPQLTPEQEEERRRELSDLDVSFSDRLAMIGSAFLWIFLPCVLVLVGLSALVLFLFGII